jgi:heat shock protein HtpX
MVAFGRGITTRIFRVIEVSPDEYKSLQERIKELSQKLDIQPPKVGLVEDLRPNAFTIGFSSNTVIVFSLGILKILNEDELSAVAAHELSHIKNNDFFFKTLSLALAIASFFNPIAYFLALAGHREREMLTDEESIKILEKPKLLVEALTKTYKVLDTFPKEGILTRLASGLFLVSPIAIKHNILFQTHPKLDQRVTNIKKLTEEVTVHHYNYKTTVALSLLIILFGIASTYPFISIQVSFIREQRILPFRGIRLDFIPNLRNKNFGSHVYHNAFIIQPKVNLYHGHLIRTTLRDTTFSGSCLTTSGPFSVLRTHTFLYRNIFLNFIQRRFSLLTLFMTKVRRFFVR